MKKVKAIAGMFFLAALIVPVFTGCADDGPGALGGDPADTAPPSSLVQPAGDPGPGGEEDSGGEESPGETPVSTGTPEARPEQTRLPAQVEGQEETVDSVLETGDFSKDGRVRFSLYIDSSRYQAGQAGRKYVYSPDGSKKANAYLEISFVKDGEADFLANGILDEYDSISDMVSQGEVSFGSYPYTAQYVTGSSHQRDYSAYLIQVETGVIFLVISTTPEASEGHGARLLAAAETFVFEYI